MWKFPGITWQEEASWTRTSACSAPQQHQNTFTFSSLRIVDLNLTMFSKYPPYGGSRGSAGTAAPTSSFANRSTRRVPTSMGDTQNRSFNPLHGGSRGSAGTAAPTSSFANRSTPRAPTSMGDTQDRSFNPLHGATPRATEELRIVLVGKTGSGKSASGNTILGWETFESVMSPTSITDECSKARATVQGQDVVVIDTPGLFDTRHGVSTTCRHISQCMSYASPGPHAFLIVIALGRYTEEEMKTVQQIQELFGEAADRYSMVLFTRGDDLQGTTIEEFIGRSPELQELVDTCYGQYHVFNNKLQTGPQVTELLQKIRNIVWHNGGSHYTNEMFQEAERLIQEEKQRILKEKEAEIRIEKEQLRSEMRAVYEEQLRNLKEHFKAERMEDRKVREEENQAMQSRIAELTREGERFINAKVKMEVERHREKQNMELVVARERQDRDQMQEQMQNMFMALSMQNNQYMMAMQTQQQQQQFELERQRMEMHQREESVRRERELERARWETEKAELLRAHERDLKAEEKALEEKHDREARDKAEKRNPIKKFFTSAWNGFRSLFS